jgi:hypothetical protein
MAKMRNINAGIAMMDVAGATVELELKCSTKDASLEQKRDEIDVTAICDDGKQYIVGASEGTFKLAVFFEAGTYSTSAQKKLRDVWTAGVARKFRIREDGDGAGKPERTFDAVITALDEPISTGEALVMELEFRVTGAVTYGVQV